MGWGKKINKIKIKIVTETLAGLNNVHLIRFGVKISEKI